MEQVGGDHYKSNYQHWDWAVDVGLGPLEYGATRYICRHWKKGGIEDLEKARHFIEKLVELNLSGNYDHYKNIKRSKRSLYFIQDMNNFIKFNKIPYLEGSLCEDIAKWTTNDDLFKIQCGLLYLIETSEMAAGAPAPAPATTLAGQVKEDVPASTIGGVAVQDKGKVNQPNPFGYKEEEGCPKCGVVCGVKVKQVMSCSHCGEPI